MILQGLKNLDRLIVASPVGGAADRLNHIDPKTGEGLPAANFTFNGRPLLDGIYRDLQALEYLHFKVFGKQVTVPTVLMTSHEKDNDRRIRELIKYHRPKDSYHFLVQPSVPVITEEGKWVFSAPGDLKLKPGGHGAIWKLALDSGLLDKMAGKKVITRQINNPLAWRLLPELMGAGF